jgi:hypothetical protein
MSNSRTVDTLVRSLGLGRVIAGGAAWAAPELAWKQFGLADAAGSPEAQVLGRMFGSRDLVLGVALLVAKSPATRRKILRAGLVVDGMDLAAAMMAKKSLSPKGMASIAGGAASAIAVALVSEATGANA